MPNIAWLALRLLKLMPATTIILLGCATSQNEFMQMSTTERQAEVCYESAAFRQRKEQLEFLESEIGEKQQVLKVGYRVHEDCNLVRVDLPAKDCSNYKSSLARNMCAQGDNYRMETRCTESAVSIDPEYEERKLDEYRTELKSLTSAHSTRTEQCFARVAELTAEEAYIYYSERLEPGY